MDLLVCGTCETGLDFIVLDRNACGCPCAVGYWCPVCAVERGIWLDTGNLNHPFNHPATLIEDVIRLALS